MGSSWRYIVPDEGRGRNVSSFLTESSKIRALPQMSAIRQTYLTVIGPKIFTPPHTRRLHQRPNCRHQHQTADPLAAGCRQTSAPLPNHSTHFKTFEAIRAQHNAPVLSHILYNSRDKTAKKKTQATTQSYTHLTFEAIGAEHNAAKPARHHHHQVDQLQTPQQKQETIGGTGFAVVIAMVVQALKKT